jgi:hypothetical protein
MLVTGCVSFVTRMSPQVTSGALRYWPAGSRVAGMTSLIVAVTLVVRLYDTSTMSDLERTEAVNVATGILLAANIPTTWPDCRPGKPKPVPHAFACARPVAPGELSVRILRGTAVRDAADRLPLGYSLVDRERGGGTLATVYLDRVERVASSSRSAAPVLLGRAIAHEVGHLLLGTGSHGARGLMREWWSHGSLRQSAAEDWLFTPEQSAALQRAIGAAEQGDWAE